MLFLLPALANPCANVLTGVYLTSTPITFEPRAAELTAASAPAIAELTCALSFDPAGTLHIGVHTDSRGSGAYNLAVSQQRADAVRTALVAAGIAPERLTARGYGEDYPLADNLTVDGRTQNQRVELLTADPRRPEVAAPVPVAPAPAPAPPTLCERVQAALSSRADVKSTLAPASAAAQLQGCLQGWTAVADGAEWYLTLGADTIVVRPSEAGSVVQFTR